MAISESVSTAGGAIERSEVIRIGRSVSTARHGVADNGIDALFADIWSGASAVWTGEGVVDKSDDEERGAADVGVEAGVGGEAVLKSCALDGAACKASLKKRLNSGESAGWVSEAETSRNSCMAPTKPRIRSLTRVGAEASALVASIERWTDSTTGTEKPAPVLPAAPAGNEEIGFDARGDSTDCEADDRTLGAPGAAGVGAVFGSIRCLTTAEPATGPSTLGDLTAVGSIISGAEAAKGFAAGLGVEVV